MAGKGKGGNTVKTVAEIVSPIAAQMGFEIWDIRFEKEGTSWYLRVFIDKEGGVNIDDCENFSRTIDSLLDEADPIDESYYLEVSSPGIERELIKPEHFKKYIGEMIHVRFIRPVEGIKDFVGKLSGYEDDTISVLIDDDAEMNFKKSEAAFVKLYCDFNNIGGLEE